MSSIRTPAPCTASSPARRTAPERPPRRLTWLAFSLAPLILAGLACTAHAQLAIDWHTVDGGGYTFCLGSTMELGGTAGQPDAGTCGGGSYVLHGGFWRGGQGFSSVNDPLAGGEGEEPAVPSAFRVVAGLNNPFTTRTEILLDLPAARQVDIRVFDHSGRLVERVQDGWLPPGRHRLAWNGSGGNGRVAASGVYLLQVRAGDHLTRKRVVFLK